MSSARENAPHYTVADYQQWKGDWELYGGVAIAMTPSPFGPHQAAAAKLLRMLGNALEGAGCDATAICDLDWIVRDDTVVRPDVIVICGKVPEQHLMTAPALVAEVLSPATRTNDLTYKHELYAREGVEVYLIVDLEATTVEHLQLTDSDKFAAVEESERGQFKVCKDCVIKLDLSAIVAR